ncbi:hypothetical protein OAZ06_04075 [Synechococcus sp. AH-736-G20]|nr:hypothetical protein [Synechococcus sp. AH-736-G20]
MTDNIIQNLSPEQIEDIKSQGGFSGSVKQGIDLLEGPMSRRPAVSVDINSGEKGIRPSIGRKKDELIRGMSPAFLEKGERERQEFEEQQRQEAEAAAKEAGALAPQALRRDIEALRRELKRLTKQVKELQQ